MQNNIEVNKLRIEQVLSSFKIGHGDIEVTTGPTVTLYEFKPQTGVLSRIKRQPVCKNGVLATTKILTLQYAVYIIHADKSACSDINRIVPVLYVVMQHKPYDSEYLPCNGNPHFHSVLSSDDSLVIAEPVIETSLFSAGGP